MEEKKINTRILFSVVAVLLLIAVVAGATYAYFSATGSSAVQTVTTANMGIEFDDSTAIVNATNITPMYQSEIETKATKKSFTVTNNGSQSMYFQFNLTEVAIDNELKDLWFRWALYEDGTRIGMGTFYQAETEVFMQQNRLIEPGADNAKDYDLYIWIEDSDEEQNAMQGKSLSAKVTVNASMTEYESVPVSITWEYLNDEDYGEESKTTYYDTNVTSLSIYESSNAYLYVSLGNNYNFKKFTNVESLKFGGWESSQWAQDSTAPYILPISLKEIGNDSFYDHYDVVNGNLVLDLSYLTNLETIGSYSFDFYDSDERSYDVIKLPRSLVTINDYAFGVYDTSRPYYTPEILDLSNLINLKTVGKNVFEGLSSSQTVILPKSIQSTVSIGTGAFGSATVVYQ